MKRMDSIFYGKEKRFYTKKFKSHFPYIFLVCDQDLTQRSNNRVLSWWFFCAEILVTVKVVDTHPNSRNILRF